MKERPILFSGPMVRAILDGRKTQTRRLVRDPRVVPRRKVTADPMPGQRVDDLIAVAPPHRYRAGIGRAGAVFADLGDEGKLGLKPGEFDFMCPYADGRTYLDEGRWHVDVAPDQQMWVRETWGLRAHHDATFWLGGSIVGDCLDGLLERWKIEHRADWETDGGGHWRPSIHMPRWASRLNLAVEHVRLERLQDITEADARAEGVSTFAEAYPSVGLDQPIERGDRPGFHAGDSPYRASFACLWDEINGDRALWSSDPWVWVVEFQRVEVGDERSVTP